MQINFQCCEAHSPRYNYNSISQVCPYKDLGNAKDYTIIILFLMQPSAGDKPDRIQSQEEYHFRYLNGLICM